MYIFCSAVVEERDEQKEFETGPLSVLMQSVKSNSQVSSLHLLIIDHSSINDLVFLFYSQYIFLYNHYYNY